VSVTDDGDLAPTGVIRGGARLPPGSIVEAATLAGVSLGNSASEPAEGLVNPGADSAAVLPQRSGLAPAAAGLADPAARPASGPAGLTMIASSGAGVPGTAHEEDEDSPSLPESQATGVLTVLEQAASAGLGHIQERAVPAPRAPTVAAERVLLPVEREVSIPSSGVISTVVERSWAWAGVLAVLLGAEAPDHEDRRRAGRGTLKS
jgi:hypothetical protein